MVGAILYLGITVMMGSFLIAGGLHAIAKSIANRRE